MQFGNLKGIATKNCNLRLVCFNSRCKILLEGIVRVPCGRNAAWPVKVGEIHWKRRDRNLILVTKRYFLVIIVIIVGHLRNFCSKMPSLHCPGRARREELTM